MARPIKWRKIENLPQTLRFLPDQPLATGKLSSENPGENILLLEELEAIRLKDLDGLEQEDCAKRMQISRPTFQRILISARRKVADSLILGKTIRIEGGNFSQNICLIRCDSCGREWVERFEAIEEGQMRFISCPKCRSSQLTCCPDDQSSEACNCRQRCDNNRAAQKFDNR